MIRTCARRLYPATFMRVPVFSPFQQMKPPNECAKLPGAPGPQLWRIHRMTMCPEFSLTQTAVDNSTTSVGTYLVGEGGKVTGK